MQTPVRAPTISADPALTPSVGQALTPKSTPAGESPEKTKAALRDLAQLVLNRVREVGITTHTDVANHLVEGWQREDSLPEGKVENIRRRVYDALNVLLALGVIAKERKRIRWVGFPDSKESKEENRLLQEKAQLLEAIKQSQAELDDIRNQIQIFHSLITRNADINQQDPEQQQRLLFFPFLTLTTPQREISISIDDEYTQYWLDVPCRFDIRDDSEILALIHQKLNQPQTLATSSDHPT